MRIIGCDLHAGQQTLAMLDRETGEVVNRMLLPEGNQVRDFYDQLRHPVLVGIEASGPMQWFATKSDTQLEFGEQSLDLVPFAFRADIGGGLRQLSGCLPCRFLPVNEDPPSRSASAALLYWTASALRLRGLIKVTLCLVVHSAVAQCLALRTAKDLFDLVVLKLVLSSNHARNSPKP
jgi:hypothetical protein